MSGSELHPSYRKPLGRVLVEMGALDDEQLEQMLALQRYGGGLLGQIVVDRGLVSPLALAAACAQQHREGRERRTPAHGGRAHGGPSARS